MNLGFFLERCKKRFDFNVTELFFQTSDYVDENYFIEIKHEKLLKNDKPIENGLIDPRLGIVDKNSKCKTCFKDMIHCPGHDGFLRLARPVYHILYIDKVFSVLKNICYFCSRLKFNTKDKKYTHKFRDEKGNITDKKKLFQAISSANHKRQRCPHCGKYQPTYHKELNQWIYLTWENVVSNVLYKNTEYEEEMKKEFLPTTAKKILSKMEDKDIEFLGLNPKYSHPKDFIINNLIIPRTNIRPSIKKMTGSKTRGYDDLTNQLIEVVKNNKDILDTVKNAIFKVLINKNHPLNEQFRDLEKENINLVELFLKEYEYDEQIEKLAENVLVQKWKQLQSDVSFYFNSNIVYLTETKKKSNSVKRTLSQRIKRTGDKNQFRKIIVGKRDDHSGRTVITPDPNLEIDQVGVPFKMAQILTYPEIVNKYNIEQLTQCVRRGSHKKNGANEIITNEGYRINLGVLSDEQLKKIKLKYGCIVHRHLKDDDYVLLNRQPTLWRYNMMGHRAKIHDGCTIKINNCVTNPYNADFDGDEMNLNLPQSLISRSEMEHICSVGKNVINDQNNKPIISFVQDSIISAYLISQKDRFFTYDEICYYLGQCDLKKIDIPTPAILKSCKGKPLWTGKQLLSILLPKGIYYKKKNNQNIISSVIKCPDLDVIDNTVIINEGYYISGEMDKSILGCSGQALHQIILNDYGEQELKDYFKNFGKIFHEFITLYGLSSSCREIGTNEVKQNYIDRILKICNPVCDYFQNKIVNHVSWKKLRNQLNENFIYDVTENAKTLCGRLANSNEENNNMILLIKSQAKGNPFNLFQIRSVVGQQVHDEKRFVDDLSCFKRNKKKTIQDQGFIDRGYFKGLTPKQLFIHMQPGRASVIDSSEKVSSSGYMNRKFSRICENSHVAYDYTIRNENKNIVSLNYLDNFDPTKCEKIKEESIWYDEKELWHKNYRLLEFTFFLEKQLEIESINKFTFQEKIKKIFNKHLLLQKDICNAKLKTFYYLMNRNDYKDSSLIVPLDMNRMKNLYLGKEYKFFNIKKYLNSFIKNNYSHSPKNKKRKRNVESLPQKFKKYSIICDQSVRNLFLQFNKIYLDVLEKIKNIITNLTKNHMFHCNTIFYLLLSHLNYNDLFRFYLFSHSNNSLDTFNHKLNSLIEKIHIKLINSLINYGTPVGINTASAVSQIKTQKNLKLHHFAGNNKAMTIGANRLNELIAFTQEPANPQLFIHTKPLYQYETENNLLFHKVLSNKLKCLKLKHFVKESNVVSYIELNNNIKYKLKTLLDIKNISYPNNEEVVIIWKMKKKNLKSFNVDIFEIQHFLENKLGGKDFSKFITFFHIQKDYNVNQIYLIIYCKEFSSFIENDILKDENSLLKSKILFKIVNKINISLLNDFNFRGIDFIEHCEIVQRKRYSQNDTKYIVKCFLDKKKQPTRNVLSEIFKLPYIDNNKTITNDIFQVYKCLGIEATHFILFQELNAIIENDDVNIEKKHLFVLVELMLSNCKFTKINLNGMENQKNSFWSLAAFEKTLPNLLNAAVYNEEVFLNDNNSNIIFGKMIKTSGTNTFELVEKDEPSKDEKIRFKMSNHSKMFDDEDLESFNSSFIPKHLKKEKINIKMDDVILKKFTKKDFDSFKLIEQEI